jgi:hypothetical protein
MQLLFIPNSWFVLQKFFDAIRLKTNSDTESDPVFDIKHNGLAFLLTSPAHVKNKEIVCCN